jgi:hypothetical protein
MLLVDLNANDKITGIEFVGAKQFGIKRFAALLRNAQNRPVSAFENPEAVADAVDQVGKPQRNLNPGDLTCPSFGLVPRKGWPPCFLTH